MPYDYEVVPGLFKQSDPPTSWRTPGMVLPLERLGLVLDGEDAWVSFCARIDDLQRDAAADVLYKVLFFNRHGQGVHNMAAQKYGYDAWVTLSQQEGDGELTWRNAELTDLGVQQAETLGAALRRERHAGMPLPSSHYCSTLIRTMSTLDIVYRHLLPVNGPPPRILEDLRENVNMVCELEWSELPQTEAAKALRKPYSFSEDRRGSVAEMMKRFPTFNTEGLTEEDEIWRPNYNETKAEVLARATRFLDHVFDHDPNTFVAASSHGGFALGLQTVLGAPLLVPRPCELLPYVMKATRRRSAFSGD